MGLPGIFRQPFGLKDEFVDEVKCIYARAYAKAQDMRGRVLTEATELEAIVDHQLRDFIGTQCQQAQRVLDKLNRGLAEQAIPENRRHKIVSRRLEEKAVAVAVSKVLVSTSRKDCQVTLLTQKSARIKFRVQTKVSII